MYWYALAAFLFVLSQLAWFLLGKVVCEVRFVSIAVSCSVSCHFFCLLLPFFRGYSYFLSPWIYHPRLYPFCRPSLHLTIICYRFHLPPSSSPGFSPCGAMGKYRRILLPTLRSAPISPVSRVFPPPPYSLLPSLPFPSLPLIPALFFPLIPVLTRNQQRSNARVDGSFIATTLETATVGVLFMAWRSITEGDPCHLLTIDTMTDWPNLPFRIMGRRCIFPFMTYT